MWSGSPTPSASATNRSSSCCQRQQDRGRAGRSQRAGQCAAGRTRRRCWPRSTSVARRSACCWNGFRRCRSRCRGFVNDNPNLNQVLEQLRAVSDILVKRKYDLVDMLVSIGKFSAALGEAVASGPYFKVDDRPTCCRTRSCSRSSTPRSRSVASTLRNSGAMPACRRSGSPTRTVSASPTVHRRRRRRLWKAPRSTPGPRCQRVRRARTRRPRTHCRRRPTRCLVRRPTVGSVRPQPVRRQLRAARCGQLPIRTRTVRARRRACPRAAIPGSVPPNVPGCPGAARAGAAGSPHRSRRVRCPSRPTSRPATAPLPPAFTGPPPPPGRGRSWLRRGTPPLPGNPPFLPPGSQEG